MIMLGSISTHLTTRALGKRVRELILKRLESSTQVLLDFTGVEMASHSFCDEAFGKLLQELGFVKFKRRVKFSGCSAEVESVIKFALRNRLVEEKVYVTC
ncbi:STAS-like domain-containing protein [Desulfofundulus salinus]|uniref:DUF4325 domain-containing protein n=1 Tax=Desulfofundulus salinus TaxID=2419843 RepID=A0A494WUG1_9FIRM|nr:STAS-like domain-containing protein [Desulfofundulus salinum]RKO65752.1 DUF4325 domain-containing protein [Desulfofundulus salinum]